MGIFKNFITIALAVLLLNACGSEPQSASNTEAVSNDQSQNVTIYRDEWGVPHIHGKTDGDAAFGMGYAQAEDNFDMLERGF
ncbi:MAG: acylase, partial [Kordiimonadaceae bacterium]|nr:acylase [Kordiimonadaceae bacterium]